MAATSASACAIVTLRFESGHDVEVLVTATSSDGVGGKRQRQEDVHLPNARHGGHDLVVQEEVRPEHADHFELILRLTRATAKAVQRQVLADDARIASEHPRPEAVTEDRHGGLARFVLVRTQQPAVERLGAQQREEAGRRLEDLDAIRLIETQQRPAAASRDGHLVEGTILRLNVDVLAGRRPVLRDVDARRPQPQGGQTIRIRIGQRLQQQRVDHAEDRRVGADPNRERGDDDERQARTASQRTEGVAEVLEKWRHGCRGV